MILTLSRDTFTENSTIGKLYVDGVYECETLEDVIRKEKVHGKTAIPKGTYKVIIDISPKFKKELPRLLNVPGYEGILIHRGNEAKNTEGCILVGVSRKVDWITGSKDAFDKLFPKLKKAYGNKEEIVIKIT